MMLPESLSDYAFEVYSFSIGIAWTAKYTTFCV